MYLSGSGRRLGCEQPKDTHKDYQDIYHGSWETRRFSRQEPQAGSTIAVDGVPAASVLTSSCHQYSSFWVYSSDFAMALSLLQSTRLQPMCDVNPRFVGMPYCGNSLKMERWCCTSGFPPGRRLLLSTHESPAQSRRRCFVCLSGLVRATSHLLKCLVAQCQRPRFSGTTGGGPQSLLRYLGHGPHWAAVTRNNTSSWDMCSPLP